MRQQNFERLIRESLDELGISGRIVTTVAVHEDPRVLCSTVATPDGKRSVHIDFHVHIDEDAAKREIKLQLM